MKINKIIVLNKCPICGGKLHICFFQQYEQVYKILKNGEISKHHKNVYCGPTDESYIRCENNDFITDCDLCVIEPPLFGALIVEENDKFFLAYKE